MIYEKKIKFIVQFFFSSFNYKKTINNLFQITIIKINGCLLNMGRNKVIDRESINLVKIACFKDDSYIFC